MTEDLRVPARQSGDGREWPRMKPVFSVLAVMLAIMGGACQFAYQFRTHWTPLQRLYFPTFLKRLTWPTPPTVICGHPVLCRYCSWPFRGAYVSLWITT